MTAGLDCKMIYESAASDCGWPDACAWCSKSEVTSKPFAGVVQTEARPIDTDLCGMKSPAAWGQGLPCGTAQKRLHAECTLSNDCM